ncbi:hypothetical protein QOT17_011426 [Balamuthia mandrillaris]
MSAETNVAQGEPAATIKINVKTLDSRVHSFSVAPNLVSLTNAGDLLALDYSARAES